MKIVIDKLLNQKNYIYYILFAAIITRIIFSFGHIFSDDAYFDYLSYTLYKCEFAKDYLGYPHTPLRIFLIALTAFSFFVFGTNEFSTMVFPMIFSIGNILLTYFFMKELSKNENYALIAAFLMAFLPTDITFATINFSDSPSAFFINSGLFFLYKSYVNQNIKFSVISGVFFFLSIQFKVNIFFIGLLLVIYWIYQFFKTRSISNYIPIALSFILLNLLLEGLIYYSINGNFFYRFSQIELNSQYNIHEFFTLGSSRGYMTFSDFWPAVLERVFILNPKAVFLRRFYLFLPIIALYQSIVFIRSKKYSWLVFWYLGLSVLFIGFTSSLTHYQPIIQRLSWYMFPLFLPAVILSTFFISKQKKHIQTVFMIIYLLGSVTMTHSYCNYFNINQLDELKYFLRENNTSKIYTDHFTKYSVDLIDDYEEPLRTKRILGSEFDLNTVMPGEWVLYNKFHINELIEQNYKFPEFEHLESNAFKRIFSAGNFIIYEKLNN